MTKVGPAAGQVALAVGEEALPPHTARTSRRGYTMGPAGGVAPDTASHYVAAVRTLLPKGTPFMRSMLTATRLEHWVETMQGVEPATVRKRGIGMRRFTKYLVKAGVLHTDPMRDVQLPTPGKPRVHYLETEEAKRLADAQPSPYRALSALLAGTGIEVSVALALRRRDVDVANREIRAAGTKTHARDRIVRAAEWAWPYIEPLLKGRLPDAKLFDGIPDRWYAQDAHNAAVKKLTADEYPIFGGYTMRDQRHTYAVRAIRAGTPAELVARQLGHVNAVLVHRVYGRFAPSQQERDRWEQIAAAMDLEREAQSERASDAGAPVGAIEGAAINQKSRKPLGLRDFDDSRGGTRTRDPGIMRAVGLGGQALDLWASSVMGRFDGVGLGIVRPAKAPANVPTTALVQT